MMPPMNALRLSLASIAATSLLVAAAALNACQSPDAYICSIPTPGEVGADGGSDPCHCNVPDGTSCACTTPGNGQLFYQQCMTTLTSELDAGSDAEGGP
jgi:hypothetical protein